MMQFWMHFCSAFQHSDTGKAGLLMTPSGDSKLFNREHKFEYFKGLANARVAELQEIIKGIGGYAVNRKSAIKRPVAEATDNVRFCTSLMHKLDTLDRIR